MAERLLDVLMRASLQGAVLIAVVWAVCRLLPRLPAALRCSLWWLVCLQLLVALVWTEPIALPLLPPTEAPAAAVIAPAPAAPPAVVEVSAVPSPPPPARDFPWGLAVLGVWFMGLLLHVVVALAQLRDTGRVVRGAEPVSAGPVRQVFAEMVRRLGMRRPPELRSSGEIPTPQALGLLHPMVLLPRRALTRLSPEELSMTLCHEALHVRRGDLWLGWVPALAERLFFFHPLAHLAAREYALAREAACDAEVLRVLGAAPQDYGRLLLRLGVTPRAGFAAAGASPSFLNLKRRLQMLQDSPERSRRSGAWWIVPVVLLAGVVPYRIVAAEVKSPSAVKAVPAVAPVAAVARESPRGERTGPPPVPPAPPAAPAPPAPPVPKEGKKHSSGDRIGDRDYAFRVGDHIISQGSMDDREMRKALETGGDLLWFRRNGKAYVVRDAATLQRAGKLFERQRALGEDQSELGRQQAELGEAQAEIGYQQAAIGREDAALWRQKERKGYDAGELQKKQAELKERREELETQQRALEEQQRALEAQQRELDQHRSGEAEKADQALRSLIDEALQKGLAQEVR